jgi:hypothetical protein
LHTQGCFSASYAQRVSKPETTLIAANKSDESKSGATKDLLIEKLAYRKVSYLQGAISHPTDLLQM